MLESFRKASQSWFIKILFGLLIVSFIVLFGNSSELLHLTSARPALVVGHQDISANEVSNQFRRDLERLQTLTNARLTSEQARQFGLLQQTIHQMVSRALLDEAASDLGLVLDDATLRRMIAEEPAFQNEKKVFDRNVFQRVLARAGLSEAAFERVTRQDVVRQTLVHVIESGVTAPAVEADPLFRYRFERRIAETITIPVNKARTPTPPDDATLKAFWTKHPDVFTAPEMRGFSAVVIRTADVSSDIKPSEADINTAYQVRSGEFQMGERRRILQIVFDNQVKARAFSDSVKDVKDFAADAKKAKQTVADLGAQERKDMPLKPVADAVFALSAPGVTEPVRTELGWHVLAVTAILPPAPRPLAEVRDSIVKDLVKEEAKNRLFTLSTKLEDAIGSGAPVEEAAQTLHVPLLKVAAMDRQGLGADDKLVPGVPASAIFRDAVFTTDQGETSEVKPLEGEDGYFVLHIDTVTPSAVKPFETIRDKVLAAWTLEDKRQATHQQAEALGERIRKGESFAQIAKGYAIVTTPPFRRTADEETKDVPPLLVGEMFKAEPGGVAVIDTPAGSVVARLKQIVPASPEKDADAYRQTRQLLSQAMASDLMQQYLAGLEKDYGVTIHQAVIDRQFAGPQ